MENVLRLCSLGELVIKSGKKYNGKQGGQTMRTRIYNKCTDAEITDYLNRGGDTLFMSVGVTELHGQLPVDCESILAEAAALLMAERQMVWQ